MIEETTLPKAMWKGSLMMRRLVMLAAALTLLPAFAFADNARLTVDDLATSYPLGGAMPLMVGIRNTSAQPLALRISQDAVDHLLIRAVDLRNRAVPFQDSFYVRHISRAETTPASVNIESLELPAQRAYLFPVDLATVFAFPEPGVYHVHIQLTLSPRFENAALTTNRHTMTVRVDEPLAGRDTDGMPANTRVTPLLFDRPRSAVESLLQGRLQLDPVAFLSPINLEALMQQYPDYASRYERVGETQRAEILELFKVHLKRTLLVNLQQGYAVTRTVIIEDAATVTVNARTEAIGLNAEETLVFHLEHGVVNGREGWRITHLRREQRLTP